MPYGSVISDLFFNSIAVFELGGLDTIFELEFLTVWLQDRGGGEDIQGLWSSSRDRGEPSCRRVWKDGNFMFVP